MNSPGAGGALSPEQELALERNLVWVFGSPRSGTTWLAKSLLGYETILLNEPLIGDHLAAARELGDTFVRRIDEHRTSNSYFFSQKYRSVWESWLRKLLLNRIHAQFNCLTKRIIIKEPNGSMAADMIAECLPESRVIIVLRDGRDVLNSQITALSKGGYVVKEEKRFEPLTGGRRRISIIRHAKKWVALIRVLDSTRKNHEVTLCYTVRYEDLLKDTVKEVRDLYRFLSVEIPTPVLESTVSRSAIGNIGKKSKGIGTVRQFGTSGKWKDRFDEQEKVIIEKIMGSTLRRLEYQ